jgi:hypothetical protein
VDVSTASCGPQDELLELSHFLSVNYTSAILNFGFNKVLFQQSLLLWVKGFLIALSYQTLDLVIHSHLESGLLEMHKLTVQSIELRFDMGVCLVKV